MPKLTFENLPFDKKQRIIESALIEFTAKGYEKGNIETIALQARVSKGSIYQYFLDKKELYLFLIQHVIDITGREVRKCFDKKMITNIPDLFYEGNRVLWPLMKEFRNESLFIMAAEFESDAGIRHAMNELSERSALEMYLPIIKKQQKEGQLRNDIEGEIILLYLEGISGRFKKYLRDFVEKKGKTIIELEFKECERILMDLKQLIEQGILC